MATHHAMNDIFRQLDVWRNLPAFPLEARSEVFFALFLPTVLEAHFKKDDVKIMPQVIPQFPLRQNRVNPRTKKRTNHTNNVDFFALSGDCKRAFLIELKTDMGSIDKKQICYLQRAKRRGMLKVLEDLKSVVQASDEKKKYYYLLNTLSELGLFELPPNLKGLIYKDSYRGLTKSIENKINKICIPELCPKIEVVYIQPRPCENNKVDRFNYIYFREFAKSIKNQGELGAMFACYLRKWIEDPAKSPPH